MPIPSKRLMALSVLCVAACSSAQPSARVSVEPQKATETVWRSPAAEARDLKLWLDTIAWNTAAGVYWPGTTGSVNGMVCGGPLPPCYVLVRESKGTPTAQNPISSASGLWQDLDSTWGGFGGFAHAKDAPAGTQNARNVQVWADGAGCSNWGAC